jgi:hypothetical protein
MVQPFQVKPLEAGPALLVLEDEEGSLRVKEVEGPHVVAVRVDHAERVHPPLGQRRVELELKTKVLRGARVGFARLGIRPGAVRLGDHGDVPGCRIVGADLLTQSAPQHREQRCP